MRCRERAGEFTPGRSRRAAVVLTLLALVALVAPASEAREQEPWLEVRSSHFVVISDAGEEHARLVSLQFERVRALLRSVLPNAHIDPRDPIVVLAVNGERQLRELLPQYWDRKGQRPVAGYWKGPYRHDVVLRVDVPHHERYRRVLHEYVHLLTHVNVPDLPAWLDEGLSEFWATAIVHNDSVEVGRTAAHHLKTLRRRHSWIPLGELLAMSRAPDARDSQKLAMFYAQSWALTHYAMLGDLSDLHLAAGGSVDAPFLEFAPSAYVEWVRERGDPTEAAVLAFGDLSHLERALTAYLHRRRFKTRRIPVSQPEVGAADENQDRESRIRTLSLAESLAVRAGFLADGERPAASLTLLREALDADPNEPSALETLGYLYFQQNNFIEATRWFDRAIQTRSASHLAYFYRAILAGPAVKSAEDYLRQAVELNPGFAEAYVRLADIYGQEPDRLGEALQLMRRATDLEPDNSAYWVALGRLLVRLDQPGAARAAGRQGLVAARSARSRKLLEGFMRELER
jgi:tetratricopeptide (TPR) repeat protein